MQELLNTHGPEKWAEFGKKCGDAGKRHFGCWKS
jgi:hypothetical protein